MTPDELEGRATEFGVRVLNLIDHLPGKRSADILGRQLGRAVASIGANYRAARRARSKKEFQAKLCIVVEEADEVDHWLSVIEGIGLVKPQRIFNLRQEALELLKVFAGMR